MSDISVAAKLSEDISAAACMGSVKEVPVGPDVYEGPYETSIANGTLLLNTEGKLMNENVRVHFDHDFEDALLTGAELELYENDRITTVSNYAFCASKARVIRLPNVTNILAGAFNSVGGNKKQEIYLPNLTTAGGSCFVRNAGLKVADVGKIPFVNAQFNQCSVFDTLILRRTVSLVEPNATAFSQCPFATDGTGGYVYVPESMLSRYQNSQAWQNYANVIEFRTIEGSEYELPEG